VRVSERGALAALHRYTRLTMMSTLPVAAGAAPLVAVGNGERSVALVAAVLATLVLGLVHWRRVERAIVDPAEVRPALTSVLPLLAGTVLMAAALTTTGEGLNPLWAFVPSMFVAELQYGRTTAAAWRINGLAAAGLAAVVAATALLTGAVPARELLGPALATAFVSLSVPLAELLALRQWRLALELEQARRDAAELGATRERLRFAEDLHDILGHALEVVSLKSELAVRLGPVDPDRAYAEMVEVQRLARGALRDVRDLGRGRASTDLDTELAGAKGLLASAGIECVVEVAPAAVRDSELLGRVLREAVTNLLRHADPRRCWITVRADALSVVNDGVLAAPAVAGDGTGLASLARRVTEAGGRFSAGPGERPGTFSVEAVLA
jgi:two-component system sensor histidine kinase DesK